jgi:uncharacterized protein (TIGR03437 family)
LVRNALYVPRFLRCRARGNTWKRTSPNAWYVLVLVNSAARPATMFAVEDVLDQFGRGTTETAVYRSDDGGVSWRALATAPAGVISIACDPARPDVIYAGVHEFGFTSTTLGKRGVYKSVDGGGAWAKVVDLPIGIDTFSVAAGASVIYAATDTGIYRSGDGGTTWTRGNVTAAANTVAADVNDPLVAYAYADAIYATADGGGTWKVILAAKSEVETIAVLPTKPSTVLVGAEATRSSFVTKWTPDGKDMVYSTYLGGSYTTFVQALAVDADGNAYITGNTNSTDFPTTSGALQRKNLGTYNAFLTKIAPDGSLVYSTYLGGSGVDIGLAIAVDAAGEAHIAGFAGSADFPVTAGAAQAKIQQGCTTPGLDGYPARANLGDAFITKVNPSGSSLIYSTFLGGACADKAKGIALDGAGSAYIVGTTTSPDFPVTRGALTPEYKSGANKGFLAKLSSQGTVLYGTFVGGPGDDSAEGVELDEKGDIYITGGTFGFDASRFGFPFLPNLNTPTTPPLDFDAYVNGAAYALKLDGIRFSQLWVRYLGESFALGFRIRAASDHRVWVAGATGSANIIPVSLFPTVRPFQADYGHGFVSLLSSDGGSLLFSSMMDNPRDLALDSGGNALVAGYDIVGSKAILARIDAGVSAIVSLEAPQRLIPADPKYGLHGFAPGEILVLTGENLGPAQRMDAQMAANGRLATTLGGVTVTFGNVPAPLLSVEANRIVCIVPQLPGAAVMVTHDGVQSNSITMYRAISAVEILTVVNADGTVNSKEHPAAPGSAVTIYAAGFGPTAPTLSDGQITPANVRFIVPGVAVNVGGANAPVLYSGGAPGQVAGISQVNFRQPTLPEGANTLYLGWGPFQRGSDYNSTVIYVGH